MKFQSTIASCLSFILCINVLCSQDADGYKKQRTLLNNQIELLDQSLKGAQQEKHTITKNYRLLEKKIDKREELQRAIASEMKLVDSLLQDAGGDLSEILEIKTLRQEQLKKTLRQGYYQKVLNNPWLNLLSAKTLQESLLKWRYNDQLQEFIGGNINEIGELSNNIKDTISYLEAIKIQKSYLLSAEEQNLYALQSEYNTGEEMLEKISHEEKRIRSELDKQKKERDRLNRIISDIIKKEEAEAKALLSVDNESLTGGFVDNKNKLPWPTNNGVITEKFGIRQHPTLKNVKTDNLGIDLLCPADTKISSIYEGSVLIVTFQAPYNNIVIINHGDYTTAYYYLDKVFVKKGSKVAVGEVIGTLKNNGNNTDFHFEIWYNQKQINPELWLRKR